MTVPAALLPGRTTGGLVLFRVQIELLGAHRTRWVLTCMAVLAGAVA